MKMPKRATTIEDVTILPGDWRNFKGRKTPYNSEGKRNFNIIIPENRVSELIREGYPVKQMKPREDPDDIPPYYLKININFDSRIPPRVVLLMGRRRKTLTERTIESLDWQVIEIADISFNPNDWEVGDKTGRNAYLKSLFVRVEEDPLESKYMIEEDEEDEGPPF